MGIALIVIGVAFVFYGMTIMLVGSGSWFFAFWYVLGAVFIAGGWGVQSGFWEAAPTALKHVVGVLCTVALVAFGISQAMIASHFGDHGEPGLDYLIVLGAQVRNTGPSVALTTRLDAAYDYLVANDGTMCIVSGAQGPNEPMPEAEAMYDYLVNRGLDPNRIIVEDRAENTDENIGYSLAFIDPAVDHVGIVTNDYHVFRSLALAKKQGIVHVCGIAAGATPWYLPNNMARESFALIKDVVF